MADPYRPRVGARLWPSSPLWAVLTEGEGKRNMSVSDLASLADPLERWRSEIKEEPYGFGVSIILFSADEVGAGPALHQRPYPETFVIHSGQAILTTGEETLLGRGGQIIVVPAFTPHKFAKIGPKRFASTGIHASGAFITEWLEPDPHGVAVDLDVRTVCPAAGVGYDSGTRSDGEHATPAQIDR